MPKMSDKIRKAWNACSILYRPLDIHVGLNTAEQRVCLYKWSNKMQAWVMIAEAWRVVHTPFNHGIDWRMHSGFTTMQRRAFKALAIATLDIKEIHTQVEIFKEHKIKLIIEQ